MKDHKFKAKPALWPKLAPVSRGMRSDPTPAEKAIWGRLRDRRFNGLKFRRQHPVDRFIVDFICPEKSLVLEIDGPIHLSTQAEDREREKILASYGLRVLRFSNEDVLEGLDGVLEKIDMRLKE